VLWVGCGDASGTERETRKHSCEKYILTEEQTNNQMRPLTILLAFSMFSMLMAASPASADCVHVTRTTMQFQGADAVFTVDYDLEFLAKVYVLAFGGTKIVPEIEERFRSFDNVTIGRLDYEQASVTVKGVSHYNNGHYFHNSHDFGMTIEKLVVKPPDGPPRTYLRVNKTPNIFYEDVWD